MISTIHVDYEVKTSEGSSEKIHVPNPKIQDIQGNIMIIEGPNSAGKSTLMNLIAIGAYGETDESLSPSMRSNLMELTESSYRDVFFDIIVQDPKTENRLQFIRKKGSSDCIVLENGKSLDQQEFRQRYKLIYDIPEDPTARLKDISKMIRDDHRDLSNRITDLNTYVSGIWKSIQGVPTKEDIEIKKNNIEQAQQDLDNLPSVQLNEARVSKIKLLTNIRDYLDLEKELESVQSRLEFEKKKPTASSTEKKNKESVEKFNQALLEIQPSRISDAERTQNQNVISGYQMIQGYWDSLLKIDLKEIDGVLKDYLHEVNGILEYIPDINYETQRLSVVNTAIEAIRLIGLNEKIGDIGSISDILDAMMSYKSTLADEKTIQAYNRVKEELSRIKNKIPGISVKANNLSKQSASTNIQYRDENLIQSLINRKDSIVRRKNDSQSAMLANGIQVTEAISKLQELCRELSLEYTVKADELQGKLQKETSQYNETVQKRNDLEKRIQNWKTEIDSYEKGEKPPFSENREQVRAVMNALRSIRGKINSANERLSNIDEKKKDDYIKNPELYQPIWEYIGHRLNTVRDKGVEYKVKAVDLLIEQKGLITTDDGTEIHIGAMGTGEGQLSYIRGLLSSEDNRMLIVLLDEVGNMSNATIGFVTDRLLQLQDDGKLMIGMMVRPGDDLEVTTYGL